MYHHFTFLQVENILTTYEPHACIVVYSITDRDSFTKAQDILQYLAMQSCKEKRARILVGNKIDLERSRQVSIQGEELGHGDRNPIIFKIKRLAEVK